MSISHDELKRLLHYDPETGIWTWLSGRNKGNVAGVTAASKGGYVFVTINKVAYRAHRLAWFYIKGKWPTNLLDHKDRNRTNNRFVNIREATKSQNCANAKLWKTSTSGFRGVYWEPKKKKWRVIIRQGGRRHYFGYYKCKLAAHFVHLVEFRKIFGEFADV